jgi:hypothetical protein
MGRGMTALFKTSLRALVLAAALSALAARS